MNKWHDVNKDRKFDREGVTAVRVKYIYYEKQVPSWCRYYVAFKFPEEAYIKATRDVGIIHLTDEGLQWSDLKGFHQHITHWMYIDDPYDESEEKLGPLKFDYDGLIDDEDDDNERKDNDMSTVSKFVKEKTVYVFDPDKLKIGQAYALSIDGEYRSAILTSVSSKLLMFRLFESTDNDVIPFEIPIDDIDSYEMREMIPEPDV